MQPETTAWLGRDRIAYQAFGQGPPDLVMTGASLGHLDITWEDPGLALFLRSLASFPADPVQPAGHRRLRPAAARSCLLGSPMARSWPRCWMRSAPSGPRSWPSWTPRRSSSPAPDPSAPALSSSCIPRPRCGQPRLPDRGSPEAAEALLTQFDQLWGTEAMAAMLVPSRAEDARFRRWFAKAQRTSLNPRAAQPYLRAMMDVDVRSILPLVQAPTLITDATSSLSRSSRAATWPSTSPRPSWSSCQESTRRWPGRRRARPGPDPAVPDRRPPAHRAQSGAGHRAVFRHRRLHRTRRPAGRPALARAAERARRAGPPPGRGIQRPAGEDDR